MDDWESRINEVLSDPEQMSRIFSMAQALGGEPSEGAGLPGELAELPIPPGAIPKIMQLFTQFNKKGGKEEALFQALKPFVSPKHQESVDRAARVAKLSRTVSYALRHMGELTPPEPPREVKSDV